MDERSEYTVPKKEIAQFFNLKRRRQRVTVSRWDPLKPRIFFDSLIIIGRCSADNGSNVGAMIAGRPFANKSGRFPGGFNDVFHIESIEPDPFSSTSPEPRGTGSSRHHSGRLIISKYPYPLLIWCRVTAQLSQRRAIVVHCQMMQVTNIASFATFFDVPQWTPGS